AEIGEIRLRTFETVAIGLVQFDDLWNEKRLACDRPALASRSHPFKHKAFVRRMLVDDHQTVFRFGHDVGRGDLAACDAEREIAHRLDSGFCTRGGSRFEERSPLPD